MRLDWEELMDMIVLGHVERITARHGEVLQLRPKAANARALTEAIGANGEPILTLPRGFYLKKNFTRALLERHFLFGRNRHGPAFHPPRYGPIITASFLAGLCSMLFAWITDPNAWLALGTLTLLEIVLGIDNIIFLSLVVAKLPTAQRNHARRIGLAAAMIMRLALLASIAWVTRLTNPLFELFGEAISARDLILLLGDCS